MSRKINKKRRGKGEVRKNPASQASFTRNRPALRREPQGGLAVRRASPSEYQTRPSPRLSAQGVLDLHSDLHALFDPKDEYMRALFTDYALREMSQWPQWAASHYHPASDSRDLSPWLDSLGKDLANADTYQVTAEMVDLATAMMQTTENLSDIREEDLPSDAGFMWFDKPVPRPSEEDDDEHPPLMMHAVSWSRVGQVPIRLNAEARDVAEATDVPMHTMGNEVSIPATRVPGQEGDVFTGWVEGVRLREWGYNDDQNIIPRPLHLMGQSLLILTDRVHTPLPELQFVHMIWILMQMEIVTATRKHPSRQGRRRAAKLARPNPDVRVITLRRPAHGEPQELGHRHVDWSCSWLVRGHWRNAPHGGTYADGRTRTWINPYIKGPDGLPLRAKDILWKLAR